MKTQENGIKAQYNGRGTKKRTAPLMHDAVTC